MKFLLSSLALLGVASVSAQEQVYFTVFSDPDCTIPLRAGADPNAPSNSLTIKDCHSLSYTSPLDGHLQTNSYANFHCTENSVTWSHWPGVATCDGRKQLVDRLFSDRCTPVATHMGITYQKLVNYEKCSSTYDYPADTVYSAEANPEMAVASVGAPSYETDDMGDDGKKGKKGKKMGSHKKGPMSMGGFRTGGGKKGKKTPQTSNFRVSGEEEVSCPEMKYMIVNAQNNQCLDSSNKRLASKACDESAHQMFTMSAVGEKMMVVGGDDMCISADSATKGPCAEGLTVTRTGATYHIKFNNNKCLDSKNKNQVNLMKCNPKRKLQNWRLVPSFTYKMAQPESSGFRMNESGVDKKHKKGDKKSMGGFRMGSAGQKGNKKAMGGFRMGGDEVDDMNDHKGKKGKKMGSHKKGN